MFIETSVTRKGFYAELNATAPELFGRSNFKGNFELLDVYALGCMLFKLVTGRPVLWSEVIQHAYTMRHSQAVPTLARQRFRYLHNLQVEGPLKELQIRPKTSSTVFEILKQLAYKLMRYHPENRIKLPDALTLIDSEIAQREISP